MQHLWCTVKLTKDKNVYTTQLAVVADPRSKHSVEDRKAQMALLMKVFDLLESMTFTVDQINGVRSALEDRAGKLGTDDQLARRLKVLSEEADGFRRKIVATKEGGMITGEERLREFAANLYGSLNGYEGRPSQTQIERSDALTKELADVSNGFKSWCDKQFSTVNSALSTKKLKPIELLTKEAWEKK